MWKKKEKWFTYGVTWGHKKTQFVFAMGNTHNGRKVYCLLQATVNTFLFVCRHTGKRLATQDWFVVTCGFGKMCDVAVVLL